MKNAPLLEGSAAPGRKLFLVVTTAFLLPAAVLAKVYEEPKSFALKDNSQEQVERKTLAPLDTERLLAESQGRGKDPQQPAPHGFAVTTDVAFTPDNSGTWQTVPDGHLWRLRLLAPGAKSLNLGITRYDMPEGVKLWIYDPGHKHVEGPYTARHRSHLGSLWTPIIEGDEMVVEVFVPKGAALPAIEIGKINQGYRGFGANQPQ
jgi:lysyl endopeptidase